MKNVPAFFRTFYMQRYYLYCDWISEELNTKKTKKKYKLYLGEHISKILDEIRMFVFLVATSKPEACVSDLTTKVDTKEWENKTPGHLTNPNKISHLDISKTDIILEENLGDLYAKYTRPIVVKGVNHQCFECAAKLPDFKKTEMLKSMLKIKDHSKYWPEQRKARVQPAVSIFCADSDLMYEDALTSLGLN